MSLGKYVVAGAVAVFCTTAGADQEQGCQQDIQKLCNDVQPGEGRILACLRTHQKDTSTTCKRTLSQVNEMVKQMTASCEPDIEQFCMNMPSGKGAIANCLKKHQGELSPGCKSSMAKVQARSKPKQQQPTQ